MNDAFSTGRLAERGFEGFIPFESLDMEHIPTDPGVYAVLRNLQHEHVAASSSVGGWFKGKNPTVQLEILSARLMPATETLYIGKADAGSTGKRGLRKRIHELARFGRGEPVGHWGGRYLWQLSNSPKLLVAWLPVQGRPASSIEDAFLDEFFTLHGQLPFANLRR